MLGRIEAGRGGELKDDELPLPEQLPSAVLPDLSKVPLLACHFSESSQLCLTSHWLDAGAAAQLGHRSQVRAAAGAGVPPQHIRSAHHQHSQDRVVGAGDISSSGVTSVIGVAVCGAAARAIFLGAGCGHD